MKGRSLLTRIPESVTLNSFLPVFPIVLLLLLVPSVQLFGSSAAPSSVEFNVTFDSTVDDEEDDVEFNNGVDSSTDRCAVDVSLGDITSFLAVFLWLAMSILFLLEVPLLCCELLVEPDVKSLGLSRVVSRV